MKYIRTKDGYIYEVNSKGGFVCADEKWNLYNCLRQWQLECKQQYALTTPDGYTTCIKQADTIEELCDEFVVEKKEHFIGKIEDLPRLYELVKIHNKNQQNHWDLFGAIWTDKGLIYVAKMSEKGELELL